MKQMTALRTLCLLLAFLLCLSGCTAPVAPNQTPPPETTTEPTTEPPTVPTFEEGEVYVTTAYISLMKTYDDLRYMNVFSNEDGTVAVEFVGAEKKVGNFDKNILHGIAAAFKASGLSELSGKDVYGEGEASASMYLEFSDGTMAAVGYSGTIPEEFTAGYGEMEQFFTDLTASLPVYVPRPVVMGEVPEALLNPMLEILDGSGIQQLDSFTISQVAKDEFFTTTLGLSSDAGIVDAVSCAPMMMTTAFSLVIVTLEDASKADAVCKDFETNLDWRKWVCVAPSDAMLAVKGDQVLCLVAFEDVYTGIASGIAAAGWHEVKTLKNPDLS